MKIYNTIPYFLGNYTSSMQFLKHYHEKFSENFKEYFLYHCYHAEEKIKNAIQRYPSEMADIKESSEKIEGLIQQVVLTYCQKYDVEFDVDVHIIVGAYGSNAFTHRQVIPELTFCLEKLSSNDKHLKVIIAHEFGHALHLILSRNEGIDWSKIQWPHPYTMLLQEGAATHFSEQVVAARKAVYFSYDDNGEERLQFAENNKKEIIISFLQDLKRLTQPDFRREWFSINGGSNFGFTRLGYFIGYSAVQCLIEKYGEKKAVTLWKESNFFGEMENILLELGDSEAIFEGGEAHSD